MIDFETWETYVSALDSGSLLQCARILDIDVSTASRRLRKLEKHLSLQLFYRDNSGIFPTIAGQALLEQVRPIVSQINNIRAELASASVRLKGEYLIGLEPEFFCESVRNIFEALELSNPGLRFSFAVGSDIEKSLVTECALQLSLGLASKSDWLPVGSLPVVCAASKHYLEMKGMPQTPEEIPGHRIITWGMNVDHKRAVFSRQKTTMSIPYKAAELYSKANVALHSAIADGGIVIGVPLMLALPYFHSSSLIQVLGDWLMPSLNVNIRVLKNELEDSSQISYLLEELSKAFSTKFQQAADTGDSND